MADLNRGAQDFPGLFSRLSEDTLVVEVDETIYSLEAIFKACYVFTDRSFLYLRRYTPGMIHIHLAPKEQGASVESLAGEFCNALIDYRVRASLSSEFGKIRELVVAQAFAEGNLLEDLSKPSKGDYVRDPQNIGDASER